MHYFVCLSRDFLLSQSIFVAETAPLAVTNIKS